MIELIPAIDLLGGKVVRLFKGDYNQVTDYGTALDVAKYWLDQGAKRIHVVDLDGAKVGRPVNLREIEDIASTGLEIDFGGGIRSWESLEHLFELGVKWAILGTVAIKNPEFLAQALNIYKERIILGLDARDGMISVAGWLEDSSITAADLLRRLAKQGLKRFIYTDIARDGALTGPDLEGMVSLCSQFPQMKCIIAGGVSSLDDISQVAKYKDSLPNVEGIISGKALYEKKFTLQQAHAILK